MSLQWTCFALYKSEEEKQQQAFFVLDLRKRDCRLVWSSREVHQRERCEDVGGFSILRHDDQRIWLSLV